MATNFGLTTSTPAVNVIQSINYLLATQANLASVSSNVNLGNVVQVSSNNAIFSNVGIIGYVNGYMDVKYSNSATGSSGFTSNCTDALYYGTYNSPTNSESSNPVDYQWRQVVGGFGNTKGLWYTTGGGNSISFEVSTGQPNQYYQPVPDNTPIVLATISSNLVIANSLSNSSVTTQAIAPAAVTGYNIAANTITANNIQVGTITANLLAANSIFVGQSLQSTNATFDSPTSAGFWLDASNGSARFGGSTNIGSNLTVGNNAVIGGFASIGANVSVGGNLSVAGLITAGNLQSNTVSTTTIVAQSVSQGSAISTSNQVTISSPTNGTLYSYVWCKPSITTSVAGENVYINGTLTSSFHMTSGSISGVNPVFSLYRNDGSSGNILLCNSESNIFYISGGATDFFFQTPFSYFDDPSTSSGTFAPGTWQYFYTIDLPVTTGVGSFTFYEATMVLQGLKR